MSQLPKPAIIQSNPAPPDAGPTGERVSATRGSGARSTTIVPFAIQTSVPRAQAGQR
jgi:hypothetical protein